MYVNIIKQFLLLYSSVLLICHGQRADKVNKLTTQTAGDISLSPLTALGFCVTTSSSIVPAAIQVCYSRGELVMQGSNFSR